MPNADFFTRLGLFVLRDFLDRETCARFRSELRSTSVTQATVRKKDSTFIVDESVRRTKWVKISAQTRSFVEEHLLALKPVLEGHFNLIFTGCEEPQFLVYKEGDFYRPHLDSSDEPDAAEYVKRRRISVIIFLSSEAKGSERDSYCGGSLTLYGLIDEPNWKAYGFPLVGEEGLLIAFRSDIVHEVTPVTHGERYTVVSWFF